jgi:hypothetical protein
MSRFETKPVVAALAAVAILGGAWVWRIRSTPAPLPEAPPAPVATAASAPPAPAVAPAPPAASAPSVLHPIEAIMDRSPPAPLTAADIPQAIAEVVGRKAALSFFALDDFPHRVVATVDNLGRERASPSLWPVHPTDGQFTVHGTPGAQTVSPDNDLRYTPFVLLAETVDLHQAVGLYVRMYPLLQQAYEELGYPHQYFNDRLIAVIDLLLATPEPQGPVTVHLPRIEGPMPARPWVLYRFSDPALQQLAAGQKLLIRMGPVNERRLKVRLAELRKLLAAQPLSP